MPVPGQLTKENTKGVLIIKVFYRHTCLDDVVLNPKTTSFTE